MSSTGARHWQELMPAETRVLEEMERHAASLSDAARDEIETITREPVRILSEELRRRRDLWAARQDPTAS